MGGGPDAVDYVEGGKFVENAVAFFYFLIRILLFLFNFLFFYLFFVYIFVFLLPITMKSLASVNLKEIISGLLNSTLGLPPNSGSFASISPKALDTYL